MSTKMKSDFVFFFGKYKGKTVQQVMAIDMPYIEWCENEKGMQFEKPKNKEMIFGKVVITQRRGETGWVHGYYNDWTFDAKVFETPSKFGINNGKVSKLTIKDSTKKIIINYDRGWDIKPAPKDKKAYNVILKELNH